MKAVCEFEVNSDLSSGPLPGDGRISHVSFVDGVSYLEKIETLVDMTARRIMELSA